MRLVRAAVVLALTPLCSAQSLNLSIDPFSSGPTPGFGGAAGQPGVWNNPGTGVSIPPTSPLVDLAGHPTPATITFSSISVEAPVTSWTCVSPDTRALYDGNVIEFAQSQLRATFDGLEPGTYRLYTYSYQPTFPMDAIIDAAGSFEGPLLLATGGICPGQPQQGRHYVIHTVPTSNGRIEIEVVRPGGPGLTAINALQLVKLDVGTGYCGAAINSSGAAATLQGLGSDDAADNDLALLALGLPTDSFALFLTSRTQDFLPGTNGTSNGNLCLGGTIGRFLGPGQVQSSGSAGRVRLQVDLTALPQGGATAAALPGDTWSFQCWHRDTVGLGSNLTSGLAVSFQ